ncbi:hypothetical protein CPCC7001_1631 [Cyanobium sp. PCC 7001]|uniref:hypothetical protein n=1 Tax=Cyanobium sp. PCC 7001 TaxID=180281 RepID=UPI00018051CF|nr:hypothetical protein [Cyanobium sp. PCC 7001]EDY38752.1 hypothetical protein CPCC7001_1631 [Cyanobium sp. PCC 7001]
MHLLPRAGAIAALALLAPGPLPAQPTRTYTPDGFEFPLSTPRFTYHFATGSRSGSRFEGTWFAETVEGVPSDQRIDSASVDTKPGQESVFFTLAPTRTPWPPGLYRLEIRADGQLVHQERFVLR